MPTGIYQRKPFSEEYRKHISESHKGKHLSEETKRKISKFNLKNPQRYWLGKKRDREIIEKMRLANLGKSSWNKGRHLSEEHRRNLSLSLKGKPSWIKGKHHSEESRKKISENTAARRPEVRKKMSIAQKKRFSDNLVWNKGKRGVYSEVARKRMSETHLKNPNRYWLGKERLEMRGDKNPNWNGGSSFEPYTIDWNNTLKRAIRERDRYTCQLCKLHQDELNEKLSIHHIDYNKSNCNPNNLIALCKKCHTKTNHNRNKWKEHFTKYMEIK